MLALVDYRQDFLPPSEQIRLIKMLSNDRNPTQLLHFFFFFFTASQSLVHYFDLESDMST